MSTLNVVPQMELEWVDASEFCPLPCADPGGFYSVLTSTLPAIDIFSCRCDSPAKAQFVIDRFKAEQELKYLLIDTQEITEATLIEILDIQEKNYVKVFLYNTEPQFRNDAVNKSTQNFDSRKDAVLTSLNDWELELLSDFNW
ncbi:hypothetical protein [Gimesia maris]|uniref:hypothetical protein n=1 Tax=Gimesia maris TaxID=122 RepID=UPI0032EEF50D